MGRGPRPVDRVGSARSRRTPVVVLVVIVGLLLAGFSPVATAGPSPIPSPLGTPTGAEAVSPQLPPVSHEKLADPGTLAGSVVRTIFPNYNGSTTGNFPWSVRNWEIGPPAYVPSTQTVWFPNRGVAGGGLGAPDFAPAVLYNASSDQFVGLAPELENTSALAYDPNNGLLYSADPSNDTVGIIDPSSGSWVHAALPVGVDPVALAFDPTTNLLYVANSGSNNITIVNCRMNTISTPNIPTGPQPHGLALDDYNHTLFIADGGDSYVRTVNTTSYASGSALHLLGPPARLAYSSSAGTLAVTVPSIRGLDIFNASVLAPVSVSSVGLGAIPIATNSSGTSFVVGNSTGSNIVVVNASNGGIVASSIRVGTDVTELLPLPSSHSLLAWASSSRNLSTVDLRSNAVTRSSPTLGPEPWDAAFDPSDHRVFVADPLGDAITVLNATRLFSESAPLVPPSDPYSVAVDPRAGILYAGTSSGISAFNASTLARLPVAAPLAGGNGPILVDPLDGLLWVVNQGSGLHALRLGTLAAAFNVSVQPAFAAPDGLALVPSLDALFAINNTAQVLEEVNASTGTILDPSISAGPNPAGVAYDSADGALYVAGANLTIVDPVTRQIVGAPIALPVHAITSGILYDPTRSDLYVTTYQSGPGYASILSVIDGASITASEGSQVTMPVGQMASSAALIDLPGSAPPAVSAIWVTNAHSGTISVIASTPTVSFFTASPSSIDRGQSAQFLLGYSGGTGPDSIVYEGLPSGCASADAAELNCTPSVAGNFTVRVTVTDALGYAINLSTDLTVAPSLQVTTTFRPGPVPVLDVGMNLTANASASGGTPPYSYRWSFGDGASGSGSAASHPYSSVGTYLLSVTVGDGASSDVTDSAIVSVNAVPTGTVAIDPQNATDVGLDLHLSANVTGGTGPGNSTWNFGDGTIAYGISATHRWNRSGNFTVAFRYADEVGAVFSKSLGVTVARPLSGSFSTNVPTSGVSAGDAVSFTAVPVWGLAPYNVTWSFGDGSYGFGFSPSHAFSSPGSYSVRVALTDAAGGVVNTTLTVNVVSSGGTGSASATPDAQLFLGILLGGTAAAVVLYGVGRTKKGGASPTGPGSPSKGPDESPH